MVIFSVGLMTTQFFPWRSIRIVTLQVQVQHPLSVGQTQRAVGIMHQALAIQSVLRVVIQLAALLVGAFVTTYAIGTLLRIVSSPSAAAVTWVACATVALIVIATWVLPLIYRRAGLSIYVVDKPTIACYVALVLGALLTGASWLAGSPNSPGLRTALLTRR
jgi:hypothetical protein